MQTLSYMKTRPISDAQLQAATMDSTAEFVPYTGQIVEVHCDDNTNPGDVDAVLNPLGYERVIV